MYKVIAFFTDLEDNSRPCNVGDTYPREGLNPTEDRIKELSTSANKRGMPLIKKVESAEEETPKKRNGKAKNDE